MIIAVLVVLGLCWGSFVNALVWRLHEQAREKVKGHEGKRERTRSPSHDRYSVLTGRSMCPHCHHELAAKDLVPVLSWLSLRGKCRYCHAPISLQYPLVEVATAGLFVLSYLYWPYSLEGQALQWVALAAWLVLLVGLVALAIYDLRWFLLPNRLVYPMALVAAFLACVEVASAGRPFIALLHTVLAVVVGGGLFYLLFQVSKGTWIGGGDVKLGVVLGLAAGTPARSFLFIFLAALAGTLVSLPLMSLRRLSRSSSIPFGPFLIAGGIAAVLFGADILDWYKHLFMLP